MKILKSELLGIEENDNKLKITFKTTSSEPLIFRFKNEIFGIAENVDIYEITFDVFPVIMLDYTMKNAFTERFKRMTTDKYIINVDTIGDFNDFDEFKNFLVRYPSYVRFLELVYRIFNMKPWLFPLYISTFSYKHYINLNQHENQHEHEIEITIEKISISNIFKKFHVNNKISMKLLDKNGYLLLSINNTPFIDLGHTIMYNDLIKILEERPKAIINILIMLILTLAD